MNRRGFFGLTIATLFAPWHGLKPWIPPVLGTTFSPIVITKDNFVEHLTNLKRILEEQAVA